MRQHKEEVGKYQVEDYQCLGLYSKSHDLNN